MTTPAFALLVSPTAAPASAGAPPAPQREAGDKPGAFKRELERAGQAPAGGAAEQRRAEARDAEAASARSRKTESAPRADDSAAAAPPADDADDGASAQDKAPADASALLAALLGAAPSPAAAPASLPAGAGAPDAAGNETPSAAGIAADSGSAQAAGLLGDAADAGDAGDAAGETSALHAAADAAATTPAAPDTARLDGHTALLTAGRTAAPDSAAPAGPGGTAAGPRDAQVATPLHSPAFAAALGTQLSTLVRDGVQHARLQLNPAEMGPIAVQIALDGSQAQVHMSAEHAATRQVLEQAMPALAGALRDSGLTLTGGGVFEQAPQPRGDAQARGGRGRNGQDGDAQAAADALAAPSRAPRGVVDLYA